MKIIKSSSLRFQEGNSDKVYEADLVALAKSDDARYLVNFRYGRFGQNLREGSKTPIAVTLDKAEVVFNSLLVSKINKGYVLQTGFDPLKEDSGQAISSVPAIGLPALGKDKALILKKRQDETYQNFLKCAQAFKKKSKAYKQCNRLIWRLGELKAVQAVPDLINLVERQGNHANKYIRNYSICWALGQCGDMQAAPVLIELQDSPVRKMAYHALYHVTPQAQQERFLESSKATLHPEVSAIVFGQGDAEQKAKELLKWFANFTALSAKPKNKFEWIAGVESKQTEPAALAGMDVLRLYLIAKNDEDLRTIVLLLAQNAAFTFGGVWLIRQLFKIAEFERDAPLLGLLIKRIEDSRVDHSFSWELYQRGYGNTYSNNTRNYMRRRTWRLMRHLGQLDDPAYVSIAKTLLLTYRDKDGSESETTQYSYDDDWNSTATTYYFPPFATHSAYNQILFRNSSQFQPMASRNAWHRVSKQVDNSRTEAFRELWDAQPEAFLDCLKGSACEAVQHFGVRALSTQKDYCRTLKAGDWADVFKVGYLETASFARDYLEKQHSIVLSEIAFLQKMFEAKTQMAREVIQGYVGKIPAATLLADLGWHCDLITSSYQDNRTASDGYHSLYGQQEDKQSILLGKLMAWISALDWQEEKITVLSDEQADDEDYWHGDWERLEQDNAEITARNKDQIAKIEHVSWTITNPLEKQVSSVSFDVLRDLVMHPITQVQKLGGTLLVMQKHKPIDIPDDMFSALLKSDDPELRALAVKLLSNMNDDELAQMDSLLVSLLLNEEQPIRTEARAIIKRIAPSHKEFSDKVLEALIPHCFKAEKSEGIHDILVACITEDLEISWPNIDKNQLWRMLQAQCKAAQRVGAAVLTSRPPSDYSVRQWARLGKHPAKIARQWTQQSYQDHHDVIVADFSNALRLLDTDWEDVRHFALEYFREKFDSPQWSPEHLILLCDSVRPDVQKLGRDLLRQFFKEDDGEQYLLKLSQHPTNNVQLFASEFLQTYAGGNQDIILKLKPYFIAVLSGVNKGKVAKQRVLHFLLSEAQKNEQIAQQVSDILARQSVTVAIMDKGRFIKAMLTLQQQYPDLKLPLNQSAPMIRGYGETKTEEGAAV